MEMLFTLSSWHAYAKLREHTDTTLGFFDEETSALGRVMRTFKAKTCSAYHTRELPRETAARGRRKAKLAKTGNSSTEPKQKVFNLNTYKYHRPGDYPAAVREFGPLDGFSTQTVGCIVTRT